MGGYLSGRHGGWPTIGGCGSYKLTSKNLRDLLRHPAGGVARLSYDVDGERMVVVVEVRPCGERMRLSHPTRARSGPAHPRYTVHLTTTKVGFGGQRWWFACPLSGRRCSTLYLPRGGQVFGSVGARAYRLAYGVTRIDPAERSWWKMARIARRLGDDEPELHRPPPKPKWMRWHTYERLLDAWLQSREDREAVLDARALRFLARFGCIA